MTSRQTGRRGVAARYRKQGKRMKPAGKQEAMRPRERRQMLQFLACGSLFVILVAVKLLLPGKMTAFNERLTAAMERNMDVQAVFSAVGRAFSGESEGAGEIYQAVFRPEEPKTVAALLPERDLGLEALREYRQPPAGESQPEEETGVPAEEIRGEAEELAYVLYSDRNLPEGVSMEQVILDFDYCTPVTGTLSSPFGYREHPGEGEERFHYGVDVAADTGTDIVCFADGTVTAVGESSSYGKYCMVSHQGGYSTLYAHCSRVTASSGAAVSEGDVIAQVGETGMATGPHLHFELLRDGIYLNPVYYLSGL